MKRNICILFLILFCSLNSRATHIVGGEIYYDCLGNNRYKITMKVYRDCINGQAPYDNPAWIFIFNSSGTLVDSIGVRFQGSTVLPAVLNYACFSPPTNICVEQSIYTTIRTLPPIPGGYTITYQRCCRNNTILNLQNPGGNGATYMAHIPDPTLASCNSSPRYKFFPPIYICANAQISFDHSATDPDGDSLVYSLCDAYNGASSCCPILGPTATPGSSSFCPNPPPTCPFIAPPPPYPFVTYTSPYTGAYPMSANPALAINPVTGRLTGKPNMIGQWVVAVCVSEYRNGRLLSVNKRDFQFNVTPCIPFAVSAVPSQQVFCFGDTVHFLNNSLNATTYLWHFGVPNSTSDTSNLFTPTYVYPDSGVYHVTLIANPYTPCADTSITTFYIYPFLMPGFAHPPPQCITNNSFNFTAAGHFCGNGTFNWTFNGGTPSSSTIKNPAGIHYNINGTYPVTLTIRENTCSKSFTDSVTILAHPVLNYTMPPVSGCPTLPVQFTLPAMNPLLSPKSFWTFGDGGNSTLFNPLHSYTQTGNYSITLHIITTVGCLDTFNFVVPLVVKVYPTPEASFSADSLRVIASDPLVHFMDNGTDRFNCIWNFGDGTTQYVCRDTVKHIFPRAGIYHVQEIVVNQYGCTDTFNIPIEVYPYHYYWIPNTFTPNGDGKNDVFMPVIEGITEFDFLIFNRWGEVIFRTHNEALGWNGSYEGKPCEEGVYVWKLEFTNVVSNKKERYVGHVTLLK